MPNEVLSGNLSLTSNLIMVDEFMTTTEETEEVATEEEAASADEEVYEVA